MWLAITILIVYLLIVNLFTFLLFAIDKHRAARDRGRIRERSLFLFSLLGGVWAGWSAIRHFRHKSKKGSFQAIMVLITILNIGALALVISRWEFFAARIEGVARVILGILGILD